MRIFLTALIFMVAVNSAQAGFINDYAAWKGRSPLEQEHYVMGLVDRAVFFTKEGEPWVIAREYAVEQCFLGLKVTSTMLAEAITGHYQVYHRDWGVAPSLVLYVSLNEICFDHINKARKDMGLPPLTARQGAITK